MEGELDLRPYISLLLRHWVWIAGAAIVAAIVAFGASSIIAPTYEATALVTITRPSNVMQLDPRIVSVDETQPLSVFPELATSDQLLQSLSTQLEPGASDAQTVEELRGILEAESGSDASLIRLSARAPSAEQASIIANTWAELFVEWANEIYGTQSEEQVIFFEHQLEQAGSNLEAAEEALIEFQSIDRTMVISNTLNSYSQAQLESLAAQRAISLLIQDTQGLRDQVVAQPPGNEVTFADQLTALSLQLKAFNAETTSPLQVQVNTEEPLVGQDPDAYVSFLDQLLDTLEAKSIQIEADLSELESQIIALQRERQEVETESRRLTRNRDIAEETYTALAHKVAEERITSQDESSGVRLASRAGVPLNPVSPRRLFNAIVGGALGLSLSMVLILSTELWRKEEVPLPSRRQEAVTADSN